MKHSHSSIKCNTIYSIIIMYKLNIIQTGSWNFSGNAKLWQDYHAIWQTIHRFVQRRKNCNTSHI